MIAGQDLRDVARKASSRTRRTLLSPFVRVEARPPLVRLGSAACGWWVPEAVLRPGAVAYCAGPGRTSRSTSSCIVEASRS